MTVSLWVSAYPQFSTSRASLELNLPTQGHTLQQHTTVAQRPNKMTENVEIAIYESCNFQLQSGPLKLQSTPVYQRNEGINLGKNYYSSLSLSPKAFLGATLLRHVTDLIMRHGFTWYSELSLVQTERLITGNAAVTQLHAAETAWDHFMQVCRQVSVYESNMSLSVDRDIWSLTSRWNLCSEVKPDWDIGNKLHSDSRYQILRFSRYKS